MKKANANLKIELNVDCPECGEHIDLTDSNWEGEYLGELISDNLGVEFRDRLKRDECICPKCECEFGFDEINW